MPFDRAPTREVYAGLNLPRARRRRGRGRAAVLIVLFFVPALLLYLSLYLRSLSGSTALSDAQDQVTVAVNEAINRILAEKGYAYDDFVALEKDAEGNITAITTDTVRVNTLSTEIMLGIAEAAKNGRLDVGIPLGDLLGAGVLQGRGPVIPVRVGMMTSSFVRFENDLTSTGINQSRHTLKLVANIDIDLLIPWGSMHTTVETEIPVAETVIVGRVPSTYISVGQ